MNKRELMIVFIGFLFCFIVCLNLAYYGFEQTYQEEISLFYSEGILFVDCIRLIKEREYQLEFDIWYKLSFGMSFYVPAYYDTTQLLELSHYFSGNKSNEYNNYLYKLNLNNFLNTTAYGITAYRHIEKIGVTLKVFFYDLRFDLDYKEVVLVD